MIKVSNVVLEEMLECLEDLGFTVEFLKNCGSNISVDDRNGAYERLMRKLEKLESDVRLLYSVYSC